MIRRITLDNFMSHAHSVIELDAGLNVLIGPNNCGKSAVVEAIRAVCENTPTDFMVRHGAREAVVTIETDDDHTIIWRRRKTYASYTIDGEQNDRPGDEYLQRVHSILRLSMVVASEGKDEFQVHLGLQKSPIFLLNESKLRQATFFASSSDAEKLLEMQRLHRLSVADDKKSLARLTNDLSLVDAKLAKLESVADLSVEAGKLQNKYEVCQRKASEIDRSVATVAALKSAMRDRIRLSAQLRQLQKLASPPALKDEQPLERQIRRIKETIRAHDRAAALRAAAQSLREPAKPVDFTTLQKTTVQLRSAAAVKRRSEFVAAELRQLREPAAPIEDAPLRQLTLQIKRATDALKQFRRAALSRR